MKRVTILTIIGIAIMVTIAMFVWRRPQTQNVYCTNLFNCCSLEYNLRNLGITNVAQISATKIAEAQNFVANLQDCINVKVLEENLSPSNVVIKVKVHVSRQGNMIESGDRFDVRCFDGQWVMEDIWLG